MLSGAWHVIGVPPNKEIILTIKLLRQVEEIQKAGPDIVN